MEVILAVVIVVDLVVEPVVDTVRTTPCIGIGNDLSAAAVLPAETVKRFRIQVEVHETAGRSFPDRIVGPIDRGNTGLLLYILLFGHQRSSSCQYSVTGIRCRREVGTCGHTLCICS